MLAEKEKLLNEAYQQFIQFGLGNLPIDMYDAVVAENYMGYGTALDEKLFSAIDLRDLVIRQMEQGQGMDMKFAETPVFRRISVSEDVAIIVAEILINIQVESSRHDLFLRMTTIMEYLNGKWIAVHSHGSRPEATMGESDTWHINEWKRKNEELQKLVDEKTADLAGKNQELVIEACLERVRAQALSMKEPADMLEVCRVISEQLTLLGVQEIRNVQTAIIFADKGNYLNFEYYRLHDKKVITEVDYTRHKEQEAFANQMMSGPEAFHETHFSGKELSDWVAYQRTTPQFVDSFLYNAASLNYYFYSMGPVALGVSAYAPLKTEDLILIKRFRNVFELAYTRFVDIQQAEAQAREAKIELALERVRARTMAMQKSDELPDAANLLFLQMQTLGMPAWSAGYCIWDEDKQGVTLWMSSEGVIQPPFHAPLTEDPTFIHMREANEKGETFHVEAVGGDELVSHYKYMRTLPVVGRILDSIIEAGHPLPVFQIMHCAYFSQGFLLFITYEPVPHAWDIFKRFSNVFDQTYTRFLDLHKAEKQARDAEIELALERVRARTMAIQKSEEHNEIVYEVYHQIRSLNFQYGGCTIIIMDHNSGDMVHWLAGFEQGKYPAPYEVRNISHPLHDAQIAAWKEGRKFATFELSGEELETYAELMFTQSGYKNLPDEEKNRLRSRENTIFNLSYMNCGALMWAPGRLTDEQIDIMQRFAKVFDQSYARFQDIQKAEAQARDARIELALERVRARTMAMQNSSELREIVGVIYDQLQHLGFTYGACAIVIMEKSTGDSVWWMAGFGKEKYAESYKVPFLDHPFYKEQFSYLNSDKSFVTISVSGNEKKMYDELIFSRTDFSRIPEETKKIMSDLETIVFSNAYMKYGVLSWGTMPISDEFAAILQRFAIVFEQTYTRFLDLQKAEGQAREAQIQLSLERVRARTMAMQRSDELLDLIKMISDQLQLLDIKFDNVLFGINSEGYNFDFWIASTRFDKPARRHVPYINNPIPNRVKEAQKSGLKFFTDNATKEELNEWMQIVFEHNKTSENEKTYLLERPGFARSTSILKNINMFMVNYVPRPFTAEENDIFIRFSNVFEQSYIRFLDLQKAETQAREAQIESALEKVRSRTMAMQKSDELADAAYVLFQQLNHLGVIHERINIGIVKEETNSIDFWITEQGGNQINTRFSASLHEPTTISKVYAAWKAGHKSMVVDLSGEELKAWLKYLTEVIGIPFDPAFTHNRRVQTAGSFSKGMLVLTTPEPLPEESIHLLEKFAGVFDLTYTRFNDLLLAEAQTHKANIEVALERVRARALAMQEPEELIEVAEVLRHEMGLLGVEELETSSIYLHDDKSDTVECWYAISDLRHPEKKLVADQINIDLQKTWVGRQMFDFYESDKNQISILMQGANRIEWIKYCASVSTVLGDFYGESIPDRTYHLYKFSNGAIGAAAAGDISPESWELLSRTASVFSLAYSRFKDLTKARIDLQKLKEEKQRAELALTDLKAAQSQLVQAEKMASLGELTAGIAHEIQNPLNFVNNFSELSNELIEEMQEEMEKGNSDEVKNIVADIRSNLEKINLHGKRADAIVKGMLQHSRTTSGEKQPTDINALAEEYLRLAYHGLRAKDKNFNATLKTEFVTSIEKIDIIPQDIGRVLLNLINNAFYAVNERSKEMDTGYEPLVILRTRKLNEKIEISVSDNGNGIPQKVFDKIFQPFFTTKPTGQGTGLGLSLSYDIVKAHGGELKVETKEGEGSSFTIQLPNA